MIIENTGKGAAWTRWRDAALSAGMWLVYLYWIRDALVEFGTLAAEGFAWAFLGAALPELRTIGLFGTTVLPYLAVVVANAILLILWARYNQARFRGHERHCNAVSVSPAKLGALYSMEEADIVACQAARRMTIRHASDGAIIGIVFDRNGVSRVYAPSTTVAAEGGGEVCDPAAVPISSSSSRL